MCVILNAIIAFIYLFFFYFHFNSTLCSIRFLLGAVLGSISSRVSRMYLYRVCEFPGGVAGYTGTHISHFDGNYYG